MTRRKSVTLTIGAAVVALAIAAGAAANSTWRFIDVGRNEVAVFRSSGWSCNNYGPRVECQSGDAFPYAILTSSRTGGVTVKVVRLGGPQSGRVIRTRDRHGRPVYVFTAG